MGRRFEYDGGSKDMRQDVVICVTLYYLAFKLHNSSLRVPPRTCILAAPIVLEKNEKYFMR